MRRRKKKPQTEASAATEKTPPLQPAYPDSAEPMTEPSEEQPAATDEGAEAAAPAQPARRRRKKRKPAQPAAESESAAAVPESVETEGLDKAATESAVPVEAAEEQPSAEVTPNAAVPTAPAEPVQPTGAQPASGQSVPAPAQKQGRPSKGAVVLAVGLPGSGKSTWFKRRGVSPLSSDMVRHVLFDNPTEQRYQDLVFGTLRSLLRARLIARMPMNYVDATNLSPKERRHWIKMAKDFGYEVHAVYFDVPLEVCMERNRKRGRVVPDDVMQRMSAKLRPPTFDEGFSKIIVVRVKQKPGEAADESVGSEVATPEAQNEV